MLGKVCAITSNRTFYESDDLVISSPLLLLWFKQGPLCHAEGVCFLSSGWYSLNLWQHLSSTVNTYFTQHWNGKLFHWFVCFSCLVSAFVLFQSQPQLRWKVTKYIYSCAVLFYFHFLLVSTPLHLWVLLKPLHLLTAIVTSYLRFFI